MNNWKMFISKHMGILRFPNMMFISVNAKYETKKWKYISTIFTVHNIYPFNRDM